MQAEFKSFVAFRQLKALLNDCWLRWWKSRQAPSQSLRLSHRNVFILPTRAGLLLAVTLLVLLIGAINYQLNLGYLLTFLLAGCSVAGMHVGHSNLRGLVLTVTTPKPCFCGDNASLRFQLCNTSDSIRYAIGMRFTNDTHWSFCDVPANGICDVQLNLAATARRGLFPLAPLTAETRFPMGTFRVWCLWQPKAMLLVYPRPETNPPPLPGSLKINSTTRQGHSGEAEGFEGVRAYQRGDSVKRIVWKKAAQKGQLVSRDDQQADQSPLWLELSLAGPGSLEQRLSRLCAWVLAAHSVGLEYGLRLPGKEFDPAKGRDHFLRCLEALARC